MTTYGPFAETTPRGQTGWIDERRRPVTEHVRAMLGKLDGAERFTYCIWRGTNPESLIVTRRDVGDSFIQAAGSADVMTVEVRLPGADGRGQLYTVGLLQPASDESVLVPIGSERAVRVSLNEVFTAGEAAEVFDLFARTGGVDGAYSLRELDLGTVQSERR